MLHCPNHTCQTRNPEANRFCQACGAFLPKHYLWAVGQGVEQYRPGHILANRYYCKASRVFLDTQPGINPDPFQELPAEVGTYLRLAPYRLHVPQVYDVIEAAAADGTPMVLLEDAPIDWLAAAETLDTSPDLRDADPVSVPLLPSLRQAWPEAIALRQLNWLWQLAQLWQPLQEQGVARTVLEGQRLRVEGGILRLMDFQPDGNTPPSLADLGGLWQTWLPDTQPAIAPFLEHLCHQLSRQEIDTAEGLLHRLDAALAVAGRSQIRHITLSTQTDQGPHRKRNEDACFPDGGSLEHYTLKPTASDRGAVMPLVVVCDGIGGHQGGDVASGLAIATIQDQIRNLQGDDLTPDRLTLALEQAACAANDLISNRNDQEQRHDRERMGTTLVMGLVHHHELYITHVGDSRAYRVSPRGCHQVTLDDDIASREVRMGYSSFRQAVQQPIGGSLVQALGMGPSNLLRPTVQRFILDEDCVFLLCSDGLSDFDRVEEYWDSTLLGILQNKLSVEQVTRELVTIANTRNGHDNVTVGLLHCAVEATTMPTLPAGLAIAPTTSPPTPRPVPADPPTVTVTAPVAAPSKAETPNVLALLLSCFVLISIGVGIGYVLFPSRFDQWLGRPSASEPEPEPVVRDPELEPDPPSLSQLDPNLVVQLQWMPGEGELAFFAARPAPPTENSTEDSTEEAGAATSEPSPPNPDPIGTVAIGSVLRIQTRNARTAGDFWVQVRVCSTPSAPSLERSQPSVSPTTPPDPSDPEVGGESLPADVDDLPDTLLQPGDQAWVREADLLPLVTPLDTPDPETLGNCPPPAS
jgi:serine/threonine protein phosphatase PrpC